MKTLFIFKRSHLSLLTAQMKRTTSQLLLAFSVLVTSSCHQKNQDPVHNTTYFDQDSTAVQFGGEKMIPIQTPRGKFNVWTKRIGDNPKIKVLILSGGPGLSHEYLNAFESFFPKEGIELIYYDQLNTGYSDHSKDTSLFNIKRSVEEVEQVRSALHLDKDNFYLYGHSWGGIIAMEYAVKYQKNLKALIVSDMAPSGKDYDDYTKNVLVKQLPGKVLDSLNQYEAKKDYENPKYEALLTNNFYTRFIYRKPMDQWPLPIVRAFAGMNNDYYKAMQGPSELHLYGKIKDWNIRSRLSQITVPTLSIGAKYDEMNPEDMKWIAAQVQHGKYLYCANGSHFCMYDDQQFYMKNLIKFIKDVDGGPEK